MSYQEENLFSWHWVQGNSVWAPEILDRAVHLWLKVHLFWQRAKFDSKLALCTALWRKTTFQSYFGSIPPQLSDFMTELRSSMVRFWKIRYIFIFSSFQSIFSSFLWTLNYRQKCVSSGPNMTTIWRIFVISISHIFFPYFRNIRINMKFIMTKMDKFHIV